MTLYLVRHARALAGIEALDPGLDTVGQSQAEHVARALKPTRVKRLVCSPLVRARETAAPIARELGLEPELCEEISEVFPTGATVEARRAMLVPLLSGKWSLQPEELRRWRSQVLSTLVELGRAGDVIVVSHFVAISAAIGVSTEDDRVSPCALVNASITTMEVVGGKLSLRLPGQVAHLPADEITATHAVLPGNARRQ